MMTEPVNNIRQHSNNSPSYKLRVVLVSIVAITIAVNTTKHTVIIVVVKEYFVSMSLSIKSVKGIANCVPVGFYS